MHRSTRISIAILIGSLSTFTAIAQTVVVHNARVYTPIGDTVREYAGVVIKDGKVQRLLDAGTAIPTGSDIRRIDAGGKTVLPGLIDAHGHVLGLGQLKLQADLRGSESIAAALDRVRRFAAANPTDGWIIGHGWNQVLWPDKQFPTARDLDAVVSDRPVVLSRVDGHAVWVNTRALQIAGITRETRDPQGGQIVRDAAGDATGVLVDLASALVEERIPAPTDKDLQRALHAAMSDVASLGLTGVHDAGISIRDYAAYQALGKSQQLPIRIYAMLADSEAARATIRQGPQAPQFDDRLQMRAVKSVIDGALGSRGATMLQDYSDQPHHRGLMLYTAPQIAQLADLTASSGWQLNIHAIGDAGNRLALDTYERELTAAQRNALRPRIEHAQIVAPEDIPRFSALGVIASIQPTHATSDMNMAEDRVGPQRIKGAYAWRTLLNSGARLAGGSDFPVELPNPFLGLHAAVTRQDRDGKPPGGWYGNEKLTREEALRLFTIDAAYAAFMEDRVGSLEPGKWADFILIDRDYFKVPESEIDDIRVEATYVAGKKVSGR
ncbi:amidohydrolase [Povalibacter sp.]|uniref:amidohydrolase n=1 Tax=Povalibacter sp. TaxID=1962978 RepID=UPI002F4229C2